jgi:hypothetical protein
MMLSFDTTPDYNRRSLPFTEGGFMTNKAFRFGVVTGGHPSRSAWMALAQRVEELGYSSLLVPDVLGTPLATINAL